LLLRHDYLRLPLANTGPLSIEITLMVTSDEISPVFRFRFDCTVRIVPARGATRGVPESFVLRIKLFDLCKRFARGYRGNFLLPLPHTLADASLSANLSLPFEVLVAVKLAPFLILASNSQFDLR
jgi:hypothetical protein